MSEMVFTLVLLIITLGAMVLIVALTRPRRKPTGQTGIISGATSAVSNAELFWTLLALVTGNPIFMLLLRASNKTGQPMPPAEDMMQMMMNIVMTVHQFMAWYLPYVLIPSLVILLLITLYSRTRYPRLFNRIIAGLGAGALGTIALDIFRYPLGVQLGGLPGDLPTMFGMFITGTMPATTAVILIGYLYHFLNGAGFGLTYTLIAGKAKWYWGLVWALIIEILMMTTPPLLIMGVGPFGINPPWWPKLFLTSLIAHISLGIALGLLAERFVKEKGTIFAILRSRPESSS